MNVHVNAATSPPILQPDQLIELIKQRTGLSVTKIASEAGVSHTTLTRKLREGGGFNTKTVEKLLIMAGITPNASGMLAFSEPEIEPYDASDIPTNPKIQHWRIKSTKLLLAGYLPGDILEADARLDPREGDTVIAQIYDFDSGSAETVIRIVKNGHIVTASPNMGDFESDDLRDRSVAVKAVVVKSWRQRD